MSNRIFSYALIMIVCFFRLIANCQIITTVTGDGILASSGDGGSAILAQTANPCFGSFDSLGNYYFGEGFASTGPKIRKITSSNVITTVVGTGIAGYSGDGGAAISATFQWNLARTDKEGNIYIPDYYNNRVRMVSATTGIIQTIAGNGIGGSTGDGGPATLAQITPVSVCPDNAGNLFISENGAGVRKLDLGTGIISHVCSVNGSGMAFDTSGNLYLSGVWIFRIDTLTGDVDTIGGTGSATYNGEGLIARLANFRAYDMALDKNGNIYIADDFNNRVRKIDNATGIINTIVGNGLSSYSADGISAISASIGHPSGVSIDDCGNIFIAELGNNRIRKVEYATSPSALLSSTLGDTVCAGTSVTLHAALTAFTALHTDWFLNGTLVASGSSYTFVPLSSDSVYCRVRGIAACSGDTLTRYSNARKYVVQPLTPVSLSITPLPTATLCAGTAVTVNATTAGGGSSSVWHWYVNGTSVSATGSSYSYTPLSGDSVSVVWASGATCPTPSDTLESHVLLSVLPVTEPALLASWDVSAASVCMWDTIHASVALAGPPGTLSWLRNGIAVGISTPTYTFVPASGDSISCIYTSSYACSVPSVLHSNVLGPVTVVPRTLPTIALTASSTDAVAGTVVTVNAVVGGTSSYQIYWYINGVETSTSTLPYMTYTKGSGTDAIMAKVAHIGDGCYDTGISAPLIIAEHTGISDINSLTTAPLFHPNPATNHLSITYVAGIQSVTITDMLGCTVLHQSLTGQHTAELPLQLSPGCYTITINHTPPQKLIIQ